MKYPRIASLLIVLSICFSFSNCEKIDEFPTDIQSHDFVWKGLNAYYLYQDQVDDLSDRRFNNDPQLENYLRGFASADDIFASLTIPTDITSALVPDYTTIDAPTPLRASMTTGFEFAVMRDVTRLDSVVGYGLDVLPMSYASTQPIARGQFFYAVLDENNDTIKLAEDNYEAALINYTQDTLKLLMADYDGVTMTPNDLRVDLVQEPYQHPAIKMSSVIDLGPQQVGYLIFNNDFSGNYTADLNNAMMNFQGQSVNELVLDFRYNIGGGAFDSTVAELAAMITGQFQDQVLMKETWNLKAQPWFLQNQPDSLLTRFPSTLDNGVAINGLNLSDVYIILNGNGFRGNSVLELLINSLSSYMNVHVIGNNTSGDNIGHITLYDSPDYDFFNLNMNHTYGLQPAVLTFSNLNDVTYNNGLTPVIPICPIEDPLNLGELGQTTDPILARVLNFISTGAAGAGLPCNPLGFEVLYHSIDRQRLTDNRLFTKQDLPDLGR